MRILKKNLMKNLALIFLLFLSGCGEPIASHNTGCWAEPDLVIRTPPCLLSELPSDGKCYRLVVYCPDSQPRP